MRRTIVGVVVTLLVTLLATFGLAGTASAHAELLSTSPTAGSVLTTSPNQILLTFSESVDTVADSIRLVAGDGTAVQLGAVRQDLGSDTIAADVPALANGTYVVAWRAVSADSHPVSGAFTFSVGTPGATDPNLVTQLLADSQPARPAEVWLAVGRWASYLGVAVLLGGVAVLYLCASPQLRTRRAGALLIGAAAVAIAGTALMIAAQASITVGDAWQWGDVVRTRAGRWWLIRLLAVAVIAVPVALRRRFHRSAGWVATGAFGGLALLAVVAAGGHATSGDLVALGFAATLVHLGAMAIWVGGLAALAIAVPLRRLARAAYRFSPIALVSVVALATSGTVNAWRQSASWDDLVHSRYGAWLIVKLVLVAVVLAVAAASRWIVHQTTTDDSTHALRRTVLAEVAGILVVMVATAGLVNSPPPRVGAATLASANVVVGTRLAQIDLSPPVSGGTTMHVYLTNTTGSLAQPTAITVTATLASQSIGPLTLPTVVEGPGHVTGNDTVLPLPGTWTFTITARYSEFDETVFTTQLVVR